MREASIEKEIKALRAIGFVIGILSAISAIGAIGFLYTFMVVYEAGVLFWGQLAFLGVYCIMPLLFALKGHMKKRWFMILWGSSSPFALGLIGLFFGAIVLPAIVGDYEQTPCMGMCFTGPLGFLIGIIIGGRIARLRHHF